MLRGKTRIAISALSCSWEDSRRSWSCRRRNLRLLEGTFSSSSGGSQAVETLGKAQAKEAGDGWMPPQRLKALKNRAKGSVVGT